MKNKYSKEFFKGMENWSLTSAREVVPIVLSLVNPKSVVDIGCGQGTWLVAFKENGIKNILGIDGKWAEKTLLIPKEKFLEHNIEKPIKIKEKFDLAVCLEVAEHISEKYAEIIVNSLTDLAPIVLFSAAIPFQKGTNHINLKWQSYWANLFEKNNYVAIDCIRKRVWNNDKVDVDYAQNTILYVEKTHLKKNKILQKEFEKTNHEILSVVHPRKYLYVAKRYNSLIKLIPRPLKWVRNKIRSKLSLKN